VFYNMQGDACFISFTMLFRIYVRYMHIDMRYNREQPAHSISGSCLGATDDALDNATVDAA